MEAPLSRDGLTQMRLGVQKLWLAVVLQALAEQDPANVILQGVVANKGMTHAETLAIRRGKVAEDARLFIASADFDMYCRLAGVSPALARGLTPAEARDAQHRLQDALTQYAWEADDIDEGDSIDGEKANETRVHMLEVRSGFAEEAA
jgi:hypothetical protein